MRPRQGLAPAPDERPARAARPARRRRRRRRGNHRPPECPAGAPAPRRRRSAPSAAPPAGAARSGRGSRRWRCRRVSMRSVADEVFDRLGVHARDQRFRLGQHARPRGAVGQRRRLASARRSSARSLLRIGPVAGRARSLRCARRRSRSAATSTPSSEVPLISPIARTTPTANRRPFRLNPTPDLLHHRADKHATRPRHEHRP